MWRFFCRASLGLLSAFLCLSPAGLAHAASPAMRLAPPLERPGALTEREAPIKFRLAFFF